MAAGLIFACGSSDPNIDHYGLKTLRAIEVYPESLCISFLYDLDSDDKIELIEYRRWTEGGNVSLPIRAYYDKDEDMNISRDEIAIWKDPLPEGPRCPPKRKSAT